MNSSLEGIGSRSSARATRPSVARSSRRPNEVSGRRDIAATSRPTSTSRWRARGRGPRRSTSSIHTQRRWWPDLNWIATIHHGLPLEGMPHSDEPGNFLAFIGCVTPEKGVADCIELARRTGLPLRMAAKVYDPHEKRHFEEIVQPAIDDGVVQFLGEPAETIEHGVDGFLVDDLTEAELAVSRVRALKRARIRKRAVARFSPARMADAYEAAYAFLLTGDGARRRGRAEEVRDGV